jgi:hypothetical protein
VGRAVHQLRKGDRGGALPHAFGPGEDQARRQRSATRRASDQIKEMLVPGNVTERHIEGTYRERSNPIMSFAAA